MANDSGINRLSFKLIRISFLSLFRVTNFLIKTRFLKNPFQTATSNYKFVYNKAILILGEDVFIALIIARGHVGN